MKGYLVGHRIARGAWEPGSRLNFQHTPRKGIRTSPRTSSAASKSPFWTSVLHFLLPAETWLFWCSCCCQLCYQTFNTSTSEGQVAAVSLSLVKVDSTWHFFLRSVFSERKFYKGDWVIWVTCLCSATCGTREAWFLTFNLGRKETPYPEEVFTKCWAADKYPLTPPNG